MRISDWSSDVCSSDLSRSELLAWAGAWSKAGGVTRSISSRSAVAPSPSPPPSRDEGRMLGIGLRLLAFICLASMFAAFKVAGQRGVHVVETLFYRQFLALPLILGWLWMGPGFTSVKTARIGAHASRTLVGMIGMVLNFLSVMLLPLAEATTIGFTVPIFATILSALILREATGIHRWAAVIIGFCGVLVMAQPTPGRFPATGVAVAVAAAISVATVSILIQQIGRTEATTTTVFWFTILSLPPLAIGMFFFGQIGRAHV